MYYILNVQSRTCIDSGNELFEIYHLAFKYREILGGVIIVVWIPKDFTDAADKISKEE